MRIRKWSDAALVNHASRGEAPQIQVCGQRMCAAVGDQVRGGHAPGRYRLEAAVAPAAVEDQIVAIPTLIKQAPGLVRRMIGDMSETSLLRQGLGL